MAHYVLAACRHTYTVAVVVPNPKALQELADSMSVNGDWETICQDKDLKSKVLEDVQQQGTKGILFTPSLARI